QAETFKQVADGIVRHLPGVGTIAVSNSAFVTSFSFYAATPPCQSHLTQVTGRAIDAGMQALVGATVRTQGLQATSGNDGRFTIMNVPLGCIPRGATAPTVEVLGSLQKNDGTFLSGSSGPKQGMPDTTTDVGDVRLTTPLYVVRAQPDSASGVPLDTVFDVFFS